MASWYIRNKCGEYIINFNFSTAEIALEFLQKLRKMGIFKNDGYVTMTPPK